MNFFSLDVTAETVRAKVDRKSAISLQRGHFDQNVEVERPVAPPPIIFAPIVRPMIECLVADSFHTKKLCSTFSSSEVRFYTKNGRFAFLSRLWGMITLDSLEST